MTIEPRKYINRSISQSDHLVGTGPTPPVYPPFPSVLRAVKGLMKVSSPINVTPQLTVRATHRMRSKSPLREPINMDSRHTTSTPDMRMIT
ncbi:unnamed protein product [Rhizoctonia solani]|uniref:Uncharacterized protein n=1 Tax=Rhizoctonia solani TaxID=456999 RepID=A0A8H3H766_9AGAM|nr:unnamed protein product [Rhizoctonia solani]